MKLDIFIHSMIIVATLLIIFISIIGITDILLIVAICMCCSTIMFYHISTLKLIIGHIIVTKKMEKIVKNINDDYKKWRDSHPNTDTQFYVDNYLKK